MNQSFFSEYSNEQLNINEINSSFNDQSFRKERIYSDFTKIYTEKDINISFESENNPRKKWEKNIIHYKKPIPIYKTFSQQKFNYEVMPSLKEQFELNRSQNSEKKYFTLFYLNYLILI